MATTFLTRSFNNLSTALAFRTCSSKRKKALSLVNFSLTFTIRTGNRRCAFASTCSPAFLTEISLGNLYVFSIPVTTSLNSMEISHLKLAPRFRSLPCPAAKKLLKNTASTAKDITKRIEYIFKVTKSSCVAPP